MNRLFRLSALLLISLMLCACATVAGTGRRQLSFYSDEEINSMSYASYQSDVLESGKLSNDKAQVDLVRKVGLRIARAAEIYMTENDRVEDLQNFNWEFNLIDDPDTVNAFCMPGGKVAFYTGILPVCGDEVGIAVVMGHEVAHALARHGNERVSQQAAASYAQTALSLGLGVAGVSGGDYISAAFGLGANVGVLLPFSRKHETEADEIGLILMAIAGYDPHAAVDFWGRMAALSEGGSGGGLSAFLSTHPSDTKRISDLEALMPEAEKRYSASTMR